MSIIAVTGMKREARIAAGPNVVVVIGAGNAERLSGALDRAISTGARGIISFGVAAGLVPSTKAGDCVIASSIIDREARYATDAAWSERLRQRLPEARLARIAGAQALLCDAAAKRELYRRTSAIAADMESHIVARLAAERGIPFAALRVILDGADRSLPEAATVALTASGGVNLLLVAGSLLHRPGQIASLLQTAREARIAFRALLRCRHALGIGLAGADFA